MMKPKEIYLFNKFLCVNGPKYCVSSFEDNSSYTVENHELDQKPCMELENLKSIAKPNGT